MSDVQKAGVSVTPKTGQCNKPIDPTSISNITAETFNKILMTVSIAKINFKNSKLRVVITHTHIYITIYRLQNISQKKGNAKDAFYKCTYI